MGGWSKDRVAGALVGLAAGDALGAGYEFTTPPADAPIVMKGGGPGPWAPVEWTDDTQMAICIAEVAATGELDPIAVGERVLDWYRSGPNDVGSMTGAVLGSALTHADPLCQQACVLWCIAIDRAVREGRLDGVRDGLECLDGEAHDAWAARLDDAEAPDTAIGPASATS